MRAKLRPPAVSRTRICRKASPRPGASLPSLTTVVAPAGYGKTTLLAGWVDGAGEGGPQHTASAVAWLRLDPADREPARYWAHLAAAVGAPEAASSSDAVLDAMGERAAPLTCVLDDVHVLDGGRGSELLGPLVDHLGDTPVHVVLVGRRLPDLSCERHRARHDLLELGIAELAFDEAELAELLVARGHRDPAAPEVLRRVTDGWPVVANLLLDAVAGRGGGTPLDEARLDEELAAGAVGRYVRDEALAVLPGRYRTLLEVGAELGELTAPLCEAVLEQGSVAAELAAGWRNQWFLVRSAQGRDRYRVVRPAAAVLLADAGSGVSRELVHRRAARWYEEADEPEAAIEQLLLVDPVAAARRMVRLVTLYEPRGHSAAALAWFERLPEEVRGRPSVVLGVGWSLLQADLAREALQWLEGSDLRGWRARHQVVEHLLLSAFVHRNLFRHGEAVRRAEAALEVIAAGELQCSSVRADFLRLMATNQLIEVLNWHDDVAAARRLQTEVSAEVLSSGNRFAPARAASVAAQAAFESGELGEAEDLARSSLRIAARDGFDDTHITAEAELVLGELAEERDRLEESRERLERAVRFGGEGRWPTTRARAALRLTRVLARLGESDAAEEMLESVAVLARESDEQVLRARVAAAELTMALVAGRHAAARSAYHALRGVQQPVSVVRVRLRGALELGEGAELPRLIDRLAGHDGRRNAVAATFGRAWLARDHDRTAAVELVADALRLAEAGRLWRPVADLARLFGELLAEVEAVASAATGPSRGYVQRLRGAARAVPAGAGDRFSAREREVISLLDTRLNNERLAAELFVSENTIKTHLRHIYRKLGVGSRDEAVEELRALGILDHDR